MCMRIRIQGFISAAIQNQILSVDTIEKQLFSFFDWHLSDNYAWQQFC